MKIHTEKQHVASDNFFTQINGALAEFYHNNTCLTPDTAGEFAKRMVITPVQGRPKHYQTYPNLKLNPGLFWRWRLGLLSKSLLRRVSGRNFSTAALSQKQIARLLLAALAPGELRAEGLRQRPYPSAGGLYCSNTFLVALRVEGLAPGVYHVNADQAQLQQVCLFETTAQIQTILDKAILGDPQLRSSQALLILAGDFGKIKQKYTDRGYRFLLLEAGHIAQNIALCATALGIMHVPLGGFCEQLLETSFIHDPELRVLYALSLGV